MNSEKSSPRRIAVPLGARWREFRIQILPLLAFATALVLAAILWQQAVLPISPTSRCVSAPSVQAHDPDALVVVPALEQASHGGTNVAARTGVRD